MTRNKKILPKMKPTGHLKLLIATTNPGKLTEIKKYLKGIPYSLFSLKDINISKRPEETGENFQENAKIKAEYYCRLSGLPTIADDGGLEIKALGNLPGVNSHRFINGKTASDEDLINFTLNKMRPFGGGQREARLKVVIALSSKGQKTIYSTGEIVGVIGSKPSKNRIPGYPYRSLFYLPEFKKFYDELCEEEHDKINHRKIALGRIRKTLLGFAKKY